MLKSLSSALICTGEWCLTTSQKIQVPSTSASAAAGKFILAVAGPDVLSQVSDVAKTQTEFIHRRPGTSFAAPNVSPSGSSSLYAQCTLDEGASVWYSSHINNGVIVGKRSAVRDGASVGINTVLGNYVTVDFGARIGDNAMVDDKSFIGASSVVGEGAKISAGVILSPGTVVKEGEKLTGGLYVGNPARFIRPLTASEIESIKGSAENISVAAQERRVSCEKASTQEEVLKLRQEQADRKYYSKLAIEDHPGKWEIYANIETNPVKVCYCYYHFIFICFICLFYLF